jgi:hypothetical protein
MAGGKIDLYSLPGSGTVLEVWMPAPTAEEDTNAALGELLDFPLDRSA